MDAEAKKKALFRAKLNAKKQEKRHIDSPIVRYNEHDQPVCRVCDVVIKTESLWPAHQASRKHHEAIDKLKANAAALNRPNDAKLNKESSKPKPVSCGELNEKSEPSSALPTQRSSTVPPDFFDNRETKRQRTGKNSGHRKDSISAKVLVEEASRIETDQPSAAAEVKQAKGALPEGFFDDKDADLRAQGITPVKPDVKDEYKEFEKLIQEDLKEVDNRLEEEEFDAAEMIEEEETAEQRAYKERVEILRKKKLELRASKSAAGAKRAESVCKEARPEDSSDDEDNGNFKVDWRAKHL